MQRIDTLTSSDGGLLREVHVRPLPDPMQFLGALDGVPRGFWGAGDDWVAWAGARAQLTAGSGDRFQQIRVRAGEVVGIPVGDSRSESDGESPRLFGGFSFLDTRSDVGAWTGFPTTRFVLPHLILERRDGRVRLLATPGDVQAEGLLRRWKDGFEASPVGARSERAGHNSDSDRRPAPGEVNDVERGTWTAAVDTVLDDVRRGRVQKAVLARYQDLVLPVPVDPLASLHFLREENQRAQVFFFEPRPGRILMGAAPEVLTELRRGHFRATAVAGSMARGTDAADDREKVRLLQQSEKDRAEHRLTVEDMVEILGPRLEDMHVDAEPRVLTLARIHHLETVIRGRIRPGEDILSLIGSLHPTPAVCGRPREEALALIRASEPFERGWYSGPVGWFNAEGDGDFVPALRAAVGGGRNWRLFAGAGIVKGSDPDAEWMETSLKFEPALRALEAGVVASRPDV